MRHYKSTALAIPSHIAFRGNPKALNSSRGRAHNMLCIQKESLQCPYGEKRSSSYGMFSLLIDGQVILGNDRMFVEKMSDVI